MDMQSKSGLLLASTLMMIDNMVDSSSKTCKKLTSEELKLIQLRKSLEDEQKQKEIKLKNGLKQFFIEGVEIYALNEKSAIKKYHKLYGK